MKSKIYFAKSNRANPNHVILVREILSRFDVDVVEYSGGAYSHKPLLECDMLIVLPDLTDTLNSETEVALGKGLFEQINAFQKHNPKKSDLFIINDVDLDYGAVGYGDVEDMDCADEDDYVNYGVIIFNTDDDCENGELTETLENRLNIKYSSSKTNNTKFKYLIISK